MGGQASKPKGTKPPQPTSDSPSLSLSSTASVHVETVHIVSQDADQFAIPCKLWTPAAAASGKQPRAAVLFIHGGVFCEGNEDSHADVTTALVQHAQLAVLTCNFRDGASATYASNKWLADLKACAVWLHDKYHQQHHQHHHRHANLPIGLVGSSSGGWFAMAVANQMDMPFLQFCILLCPVAHPQARAVYLQHCQEGTTPLATGKDMYGGLRHTPQKATSMLQKQLCFFETYKQMAFAAERVAHNHHHMPTLVILGAHDQNVPAVVTQGTIQNWAWRTIIIGSAGHEIQNSPPAVHSYDCYLHDINRFLHAVVLRQDQDDDDEEHDVVGDGAKTKGNNATVFPCWLPWCR